MKKISILIVVLVTSLIAGVNCYAQTESRWGVMAGLNLNNTHFKQNDILKVDNGIGPQLGVTSEMNIPGAGFAVDASLLYSMRSSKIHYGDRLVWQSQGLGNETCTMHYIDSPLSVKFKYHNLNGLENIFMPMVSVGPTFSFLAAKNLNDVNEYRPVSVLLHAGIGAELYKKVQVQVQYNFSIGETLRTRVLDENNAKNRCWSVTACYYFK